MRTVHRNNNVCVFNNFIFVRPDCLLTQKYLHVVAKEDPQGRTVSGRAVHDGSQLKTTLNFAVNTSPTFPSKRKDDRLSQCTLYLVQPLPDRLA